MTKKKKKQSNFSKQKIQRAQYKNEFIYKLGKLFNDIAERDIVSLLPKNELEKLYAMRSHSPKVIPAEGHVLPLNFISCLKKDLSDVLKYEQIQVSSNGVKLSLIDYYTVGMTLFLYMNFLKTAELKNVEIIKKALQPFSDYTQRDEEANKHFYNFLNFHILIRNKLDDRFFRLDLSIKPIDEAASGIQNLIVVSSHSSEKTNLVIDGKSRPVFRVGWSFPGIDVDWISIQPKTLGIKNSFADLPMAVYIQSHALQRLEERLDCLHVGLIQFNLFDSLKNITIANEPNQNILIEYKIYGMKAGYLRADIVEGVILIRTFLFILNNGTPEGERLNAVSGLAKQDHIYLGIDKISAFIDSDICSNEKVKSILEKADCLELLKLHDYLNNLVLNKKEHRIAEMFEQYMDKSSVPIEVEVL